MRSSIHFLLVLYVTIEKSLRWFLSQFKKFLISFSLLKAFRFFSYFPTILRFYNSRLFSLQAWALALSDMVSLLPLVHLFSGTKILWPFLPFFLDSHDCIQPLKNPFSVLCGIFQEDVETHGMCRTLPLYFSMHSHDAGFCISEGHSPGH